jgi:hypothetical protein
MRSQWRLVEKFAVMSFLMKMPQQKNFVLVYEL